MPLQIPLYKLFLILLVWAAALGSLSWLGAIGFVIAGATATAGSFLIVIIRKKQDLVECVTAAFGSAAGATLVDILLFGGTSPGFWLPHWVVTSIGAIIGGLVVSRARRKSPRTER